MRLQTKPAKLKGNIYLGESKSNLIRLILIASLNTGKTIINYKTKLADDVVVLINVLLQAGIKITQTRNKITILGDTFLNNKTVFDCQNSGAVFRFLIPVFLLKLKNFTLKGSPKLIERVINTCGNFFSENEIKYNINDDTISFEGTITNKNYHLILNSSSQYASGLLMTLPFVKGENVRLYLTGNSSQQYINYTIYLLSLFGVKVSKANELYTFNRVSQSSQDLIIDAESDLSALPYYLFLSLTSDVNVSVSNYHHLSPDFNLFKFLSELRLSTMETNGKLMLSRNFLTNNNLTIDFVNNIDLALPFVILGIYLNINLTFSGLQNLVFKESNRLVFITNLLTIIKQNFTTTTDNDAVSLTIFQTPCRNFQNLIIDGQNDHRCIMSALLLSYLFNIPLEIINIESVSKSDACFIKNYKHLGAIFHCQKKSKN